MQLTICQCLNNCYKKISKLAIVSDNCRACRSVRNGCIKLDCLGCWSFSSHYTNDWFDFIERCRTFFQLLFRISAVCAVQVTYAQRRKKRKTNSHIKYIADQKHPKSDSSAHMMIYEPASQWSVPPFQIIPKNAFASNVSLPYFWRAHFTWWITQSVLFKFIKAKAIRYSLKYRTESKQRTLSSW